MGDNPVDVRTTALDDDLTLTNLLSLAVGGGIGDSEVTLLHIATAPHKRGTGIGARLLAAVRRSIPAGVVRLRVELDGTIGGL
jgi:GNAT superfamily N-acetyltransferase